MKRLSLFLRTSLCALVAFVSATMLASCGEPEETNNNLNNNLNPEEITLKTTHVATNEELLNAVQEGCAIILDDDITLAATLEISKTTVIDLDSHRLTQDVDEEFVGDYLIRVVGAELKVIGSGNIMSQDKGLFLVETNSTSNASSLKIEEGTFRTESTIVMLKGNATCRISGGEFRLTTDDTQNMFVAEDNSGFVITGGKFHGFDPRSVKGAGNESAVFEDFTVREEEDVYFVEG